MIKKDLPDFPLVVYVYKQHVDSINLFGLDRLIMERSLDDCVEIGDTEVVAIYELKDVVNAISSVQITTESIND